MSHVGKSDGSKSALLKSLGGFATVAGAIAAMIGAPVLYEWTASAFLSIASQSYSPEVLEILDLAWLGLMYPGIFFATLMTVLGAGTVLLATIGHRWFG